jgi:hypothetical protein
MTLVAEVCEISPHELVRDARTAWTWQRPANELMAWVSGRHSWPAALTVSYLTALQHTRVWNLPDRSY